jgi:hypothetical protein
MGEGTSVGCCCKRINVHYAIRYRNLLCGSPRLGLEIEGLCNEGKSRKENVGTTSLDPKPP